MTAASGDQDFIVPALNNNNVNGYFGPSTMDRTHQVSFGGTLDVRSGFQLGIMSHFYSPLSTTLTVPDTGSAQVKFSARTSPERHHAGSNSWDEGRQLRSRH